MSRTRVIRHGEGEALWALGEKFICKLGPSDTDGAFSVVEMIAQPRNGPPPHIHRREDEMFIVLEGEFTFSTEETTIHCCPGEAVYLPKGSLHTYCNVGLDLGKALVLCAPSGFEAFIRAWGLRVAYASECAPAGTEDTLARLAAAAPEFGIELHPQARLSDRTVRLPHARQYWVMGQLVSFRLVSKETRGQFSVVEVFSPPGSSVPAHLHTDRDECFYVVEGTVDFTIDGRAERCGPGSLVFVPRGQTHAFANLGPEPTRLLDLHTPGGFEAFFEEAGVSASVSNLSVPPDLPAMNTDRGNALFRKHGMELKVPDLAHLVW